MRHYRKFSLILIIMSSILTSSASAGIKQIPPTTKAVSGLEDEFIQAPTIGYLAYGNQDTLRLFQYKSGWLDPKKEIEKAVDHMHLISGGMPKNTALNNIKDDPRYQLLFILSERYPNLVVYRIGVEVPPELEINFRYDGALNFHFTNAKGKKVEVPDSGVLIPLEYLPIQHWTDSRNGLATLSSDSNKGKPNGYPNIIFVLMPRVANNHKVEKVTATTQLDLSGHAAMALK